MAGTVQIEVPTGAHEADVRLEDAESADDVTDAVGEACRSGKHEVVLDLRTQGRPAVTLPSAIEAAVEAIAAVAPTTTLRCLVGSEPVAEKLRAHLKSSESRISRWRVGKLEVELRIGDITAVRADAVVNASNTMLRLGSGVSGALRHACDPGLQDDMYRRAPIEPGGLVATSSHGLPAAGTILHVATASGGEDIVRKALVNVLRYAEAHAFSSVAIPAIGMGHGGLPIDFGARIFRDVLADHGTHEAPRIVIVVLWTTADYETFVSELSADARFVAVP